MEQSSKHYALFPGVSLSTLSFRGKSVKHTHPAGNEVLSIFYCQEGRICWAMNDGSKLNLGPGDIVMNSASLCSTSHMAFPLGHCSGFCVTMDLEVLRSEPLELLESAGISNQVLLEHFCASGKAVTIQSNEQTRRLFADSSQIPAKMRLPYFKLKVQELLMIVFLSDRSENAKSSHCSTEQVQIVQQAHDFLTQNLNRRITTQDLAKEFHLNASTLKQVFKAVYGQPIATYMKEYRIQEAMRLLQTTNLSISDIALRLGYHSQSRFSEAFKDIAHCLPTDYRKQYL